MAKMLHIIAIANKTCFVNLTKSYHKALECGNLTKLCHPNSLVKAAHVLQIC